MSHSGLHQVSQEMELIHLFYRGILSHSLDGLRGPLMDDDPDLSVLLASERAGGR